MSTLTGERVTTLGGDKRNLEDHLARYEFAKAYAQGKVVLDVACGTGFGSAMLADKGAISVVGIDISEAAIAEAKSEHSRSNVEYLLGSADYIAYPDSYFDLVVSFETIEHLEDEVRAKYLDELRRVVKPDGIILISTPNKRITSPWKSKPNNPFHVLEYTREMLVRELANHHIKVTQVFGQRFVRKILTYYVVRKAIRVVEILARKSFRLYDHADSSEVRLVPVGYEPRYFVVISEPSLYV